MCTPHKQRGSSLIELIMFIIIVSVALAGIMRVMNVTTKGSADPLIHKQALAIAESMLEEVELMPFTFCDPDDPTASTATGPSVGAGACTVQVENIGPEAAYVNQPSAETRYSTATPFDNVNDYNGFPMASGALLDINGNAVGPSGYSVLVNVANNGMPAAGASPAIANTEALLITVTVTGPDGVSVVLDGIRTRYAPRTGP
jgi:MSHA pilin protein MshD